MGGFKDRLIDFEADNFDALVDKFIQKYCGEWNAFVLSEFEDLIQDIEPDETDSPFFIDDEKQK